MAMDQGTKDKMREHFRQVMLKAATAQAEDRIEAHLAFCDTWYRGEWTVDLINTALMESYGSYGEGLAYK